MTPEPILVLTMINTPSKFFSDPSQVLTYPRLRRSDRIDILRSWKHDVILLMQAADENMTGNGCIDSLHLAGINKALSAEVEIEDEE